MIVFVQLMDAMENSINCGVRFLLERMENGK